MPCATPTTSRADPVRKMDGTPAAGDTRAPMRPLRVVVSCVPLLCLLWPGCAGAPAGSASPVKSVADQWADLMVDTIGPGYETLRTDAEAAPRDLDLGKLAVDARSLAAHFALGHGRLERREIPNFADHARQTEGWLREIASAAAAGDQEKVRQLVPRDKEHCDACHAAAEGK